LADSISGTPLLTQPERLERRLKDIPAEPGCYLMRDGDDRILYVGKSKTLRSRVRSYFRSRHDLSPRIRLMTRQVCEIEFIVTDSEAEALALESNLIKNHQPHFNVLLKDDKKYPYLCITWSEAYPRIFITRRRRFRSPVGSFLWALCGCRAVTTHIVPGQTCLPIASKTETSASGSDLFELQHWPLSWSLSGDDQLR
jgi:excinuclease ABC subunit C